MIKVNAILLLEVVVVVSVRWSFVMLRRVTVRLRVRMISVSRVDRIMPVRSWLMSVSAHKVEAHLEDIVCLIVIPETFFFLLCIDVAQFLASVGMFDAHLFWKYRKYYN